MKKLVSILLVAVMILSFCACGNTAEKPKEDKPAKETTTEVKPAEVKHHIGDTVSTDIISFKLNSSCFTIALENTFEPDKYFLPKEYDPATDNDNPYVAKKGHSLIPITFEIKCLDRDYYDFENTFASITYNGKDYKSDFGNSVKMGFANYGEGWESNASSNFIVKPNETIKVRSYFDVAVEPADLNEPFDLHIKLKNSSGEEETFTFEINK